MRGSSRFVFVVRRIAYDREAPGLGVQVSGQQQANAGKQGLQGPTHQAVSHGQQCFQFIKGVEGLTGRQSIGIDRVQPFDGGVDRCRARVGRVGQRVANKSGCSGFIEARCSNSRNCRRAAFTTAAGMPASAAT
jgi:hypothetical protein